jgi:hypothetical protein
MVTDLLAYWSLSRPHCFSSIVYFSLDDATTGEVVKVYPRPREDFAAFHEGAIRLGQVMQANLAEARPLSSGISVSLSPPQKPK